MYALIQWVKKPRDNSCDILRMPKPDRGGFYLFEATNIKRGRDWERLPANVDVKPWDAAYRRSQKTHSWDEETKLWMKAQPGGQVTAPVIQTKFSPVFFFLFGLIFTLSTCDSSPCRHTPQMLTDNCFLFILKMSLHVNRWLVGKSRNLLKRQRPNFIQFSFAHLAAVWFRFVLVFVTWCMLGMWLWSCESDIWL